MEELLRYNFKNKKFLALDFESESVTLRYNRPWQVYFFTTQGDTKIEEHNLYLDWLDLDVSAGAAKVTHFSLYEHKNRKLTDPLEALNLFNSYLYNKEYLICGHNILGFDAFIHNYWRNTLNQKTDYSWLNRLYDTHCLFKAYKLGLQPPKDKTLLEWQFQLYSFKQKGLKSNVGFCCDEFQIPVDKELLHDATYDVLKTFEIFKKLINLIEI